MSRSGRLFPPNPAPISHRQSAALAAGLVGSQLLMIVPKMSLNDSFSAPDCPL
jgi:hypothetical protein